MLTMIPGGALTQLTGAKSMLTITGYAIGGLIMLLPLAARGGHLAICGIIAACGFMNGPFLPGHYQIKGAWAPHDASRAWAILIMTLGSTWATMVAGWLTPFIAGRWGWRAVPFVYGGTIIATTAVWQACAYDSPVAMFSKARARLDPIPTGSPAAVGDRMSAPRAEPKVVPRPKARYDARIVTVKPAIAMIGAQAAGMAISNGGGSSIIGAWAPTYYIDVLGVPMSQVGVYLSAPMLVAFVGKVFVAAYESWLRKRGTSLLSIRKISNTIAAAFQSSGLFAFSFCKTPTQATLAYVWIQIGGSFNNSGFSSNYLDLGGDETATFTALANTSAWLVAWLVQVASVTLRTITGSWKPLFWLPCALQVVTSLNFLSNASVSTARSHLEARNAKRE